MSIAIYPGTFDPITKGHVDIVTRAARLFDRVVVAVAESARKTPAFNLEQRIEWCKLALSDHANILVETLTGLSVDFARRHQATILLRGLRAVADFEYELQIAAMNRHLAPELETVFLAPAEQYSFISSTIVREIISIGGDVSAFVPAAVVAAMRQR